MTGDVVGQETALPSTKTIVGDLLDIDRDLYIVRGERGEIQIEATYKTDITEEFKFGDRIKALVLMNNRALKIERAGPNDVPGVVVHGVTSFPDPDPSQVQKTVGKKSLQKDSAAITSVDKPVDGTRVVEGQILMIDGDFYVLRGERGEIRVERTDKTKVTEEFKFGDFIKAKVTSNEQALLIERLR